MSQKIVELLKNKLWLGLFVVAAVLALATDFVFIGQALQSRRQTEGDLPQSGDQPAAPTNMEILVVARDGKNFTFVKKDGSAVKFIDGKYSINENGEPHEISVYGEPVIGDMGMDGSEETVFIISEWFGGTGNFRIIYVASAEGDAFREIAGFDLGDRVVIKDVKLQGNEIILPMVVQGPNDGMCCPTQEITKTLVFENNQLKEK